MSKSGVILTTIFLLLAVSMGDTFSEDPAAHDRSFGAEADMNSQMPPTIVNCPPAPFVTDYDQSLNYQFDGLDPEGYPISFELVQGPGAIGYYTGLWTFHPDISDAGETYLVDICVGDPSYSCPGVWLQHCEVDVAVESACGDVNGDGNLNILDITSLIGYLYKAGMPPYYFYHADVNASGNIDINDITAVLRRLYFEGTELNCGAIRTDFPLSIGSWWKYEREDRNAMDFDTVLVSVIDYNSLQCENLNSGEKEYETVSIHYDTITIDKITLPSTYIFPLVVGNSWEIIEGSFRSRDSVTRMISIDVPAGSFSGAFEMIKTFWVGGIPDYSRMEYEWFVPGTGMVRRFIWHSVQIPYDESWELIDYHIGN